MKRKYRIVRTNLGYNIVKKKENENWTMELWFLWPHNMWTLRKDHARTLYTEDDARDVLVLVRRKDGKDGQDAG